MSWGTEKILEASKTTQHITAKFIGHGCTYLIFLGTYVEDSIEISNFSIEWEEQNYNIQFGKCLTARNLTNTQKMQVFLHINPNFTYNIWIHDPHFQVLSNNPSSNSGFKILLQETF